MGWFFKTRPAPIESLSTRALFPTMCRYTTLNWSRLCVMWRFSQKVILCFKSSKKTWSWIVVNDSQWHSQTGDLVQRWTLLLAFCIRTHDHQRLTIQCYGEQWNFHDLFKVLRLLGVLHSQHETHENICASQNFIYRVGVIKLDFATCLTVVTSNYTPICPYKLVVRYEAHRSVGPYAAGAR